MNQIVGELDVFSISGLSVPEHGHSINLNFKRLLSSFGSIQPLYPVRVCLSFYVIISFNLD